MRAKQIEETKMPIEIKKQSSNQVSETNQNEMTL